MSQEAPPNSTTPLRYRDAGVDIAAADALSATFARLAASTHTPDVVAHPSGYAGLLRLPLDAIREPVLATTCDGVGTKLLVAKRAGHYAGLGQDLVAMSVNDLLPLAARPLAFLDYIATGALDSDALTAVVDGVAAACRAAGCSLLGGETAELPGLYSAEQFDLAGFAVGLADGARLPEPERIKAGDRVLALPAQGIHANGFSLVRAALFERGQLDLHASVAGLDAPLADVLLRPTPLYVQPVLQLLAKYGFHAAAHITGGGLLGRLGAILPAAARQHLHIDIDPDAVPRLPIFELIAEAGQVSAAEMANTFNMGLGFVIVVAQDAAPAILREFPEWLDVGVVRPQRHGAARVRFGELRA